MRSLRFARKLLPIAFALAASACAPLLPLVGSLLGGSDAAKPQLAGPFAGGPTVTQNTPPLGSLMSEAIARTEQQPTKSCESQLPAADGTDAAAAASCPLRLVCLPGSSAPIRLRVCSGPINTIEPATGGTGDTWLWNSDLGTASEPVFPKADDDRRLQQTLAFHGLRSRRALLTAETD
jgi:hypothetical protein